jgi:hypothetical protein
MLLRRLRGLLAATAGGALVGGAAGAALGLIFLLTPGPKVITIVPAFPGAVVLVPALWGAVVGAISGGAFGVLMMLAERGHGILELRAHRVAGWAAIASAGALRLGGASWTLVALVSGLGAGIGAAATLLAKRGEADPAAAASSHFPPT